MCDPDNPDLVISAGKNIFWNNAAVLYHDDTVRQEPEIQENAFDRHRITWQCTNSPVRKNDLHGIPLKLLLPGFGEYFNHQEL